MYSLKILTGHGEKFATIAPNRCIIIIIHFRYVRLNLIWCNSSWILKLSCDWHDHFINWLFSREISSNKNISYIYMCLTLLIFQTFQDKWKKKLSIIILPLIYENRDFCAHRNILSIQKLQYWLTWRRSSKN
jgi:hypothetical protein